MNIYTIRNLRKKNSGIKVFGRVLKSQKFLQFEDDSSKFTIWKIHLSDYTGSADFFFDEKSNIGQGKLFCASDIKLIFYRGKKKFICRQFSTKFKNDFFQKLYNNQGPNLSLAGYKLL